VSLRLNIYEKRERSRNVVFISLLEFNPKTSVVDPGCGDGEFKLKAKEKICCNEMIELIPIRRLRALVIGGSHAPGRPCEVFNEKNTRFTKIKLRKVD
jgi:hypothetical protein